MTIDAIRTRTTNMTNMTNTMGSLGSSDVRSSNRLMRGQDLFADGMDDRRTTASTSTPVQPTSLIGDLIGGVAGGIGSLVRGVVDAIGDGLGALARGDILGALASIPRAFINTALGGFGLFTDVALGLVTTVIDGVLGLFRR